jgi:hypothetical protein
MRVCVRVRRDATPLRTRAHPAVARCVTSLTCLRIPAFLCGVSAARRRPPRSSCPTLLRPVLSRIGDSELGLGGQLSGLINT